MNKMVIAGGTGFIGLSLAKHLSEKGITPVIIGRNKPKDDIMFDFVQWDAVNPGDWVYALENAHAIVNLTGKTVDCIKTPENCDVILRSRVESTRAIGKALLDKKKTGQRRLCVIEAVDLAILTLRAVFFCLGILFTEPDFANLKLKSWNAT